MSGPISSHAAASIGFEFTHALKLCHPAKCAFVKVEIPLREKMHNPEHKIRVLL
jgi:hypothetical protein